MALKTNVHIKYRTPYIKGVNVPEATLKLMRSEITNMRKNLIKKQKRLQKSTEFKASARALNTLQNIRVKDLKTPKQVQDTWNRLRSMQENPMSSVTGQRRLRDDKLEHYKDLGMDVNKERLAGLEEMLDKATEEYAQELYISSDEVVNYYLSIYDNYKTDRGRMNEVMRYIDKTSREFGEMGGEAAMAAAYKGGISAYNDTNIGKKKKR